MPRTKSIFECVFNLPLANRDLPRTVPKLEFYAVAAGIDDQTVLEARRNKEIAAKNTFEQETCPRWKDLTELHRWIFEEHTAYHSQRLVRLTDDKSKSTQDELLLKTY